MICFEGGGPPMFSSTGVSALSSEWTNWHLLFARQPEPDLEFSEDDLDEPMPPPAPPMHPPRSGNRPLLWIFLLLVVGGMAMWPWTRIQRCNSSNPTLRNAWKPPHPPLVCYRTTNKLKPPQSLHLSWLISVPRRRRRQPPRRRSL